jgi:serine/threonine-protein kinase
MSAPNPQFWEEVEEIVDAAIDEAAESRARLLDERCAGRPDLRAEVESLLASSSRAGAFLAGTALDAPLSGDTQPPDLAGTSVGAFRLERRIGAGGMGVVYEAKRTGDGFEQRVAVKLVDAPLRGRTTLRYFKSERQILASLHHPHIVALLDGGVSAAGQPYLVMEYVDGTPITRHCSGRALDLEARLRLFQQVCAAVQNAHGHGVVHRDIKPGNILVTSDGIPKILDFGVAKLLDDSPSRSDATLTGLLDPLTPNYASPEQLRGLAITTASDIYALGVLLFELLAGVRCYDTSGKPLDEVVRIVVDDAPRRPSDAARAAEGGLPYDARRLRGDLDAIVLKAMAKEPVRRYASAQELSDDIGRYLGGRAVIAREPSFGYVVRRLAARHKVAVASAVVSIAGIVVALAVALWQAQLARVERDRAQIQSDKATQVSSFLRRVLGSGAASASRDGQVPTLQDVLEAAETGLEKELAAQPEVMAAMLAVLGVVYIEQGNTARATLLLERSLAIRERLLPADHEDIAESLYALGRVKRSKSAYEPARRDLERSLRIRERVLGPDHPLLAEVLSELGNVGYFTGKYEEGRAALRRAVAIEEKHGGRRLAFWLTNLSNLEIALDDYAAGRQTLERSLEVAIKTDGRLTSRADASLINLAVLLRQQEEFERARGLFEQAMSLIESAYSGEHPGFLFTLGELGELFIATGDHGRAREYLERCLRDTERIMGPDHGAMAAPLTYYGRLQLAAGNPIEALASIERALQVRRKVLGTDRHADIAENLVDVARVKARVEGNAAAEPIIRRALATQREVLPAGHRGLLSTLLALVDVLPHGSAEIRVLGEEAARIAQAKLPPKHSLRVKAEALSGR